MNMTGLHKSCLFGRDRRQQLEAQTAFPMGRLGLILPGALFSAMPVVEQYWLRWKHSLVGKAIPGLEPRRTIVLLELVQVGRMHWRLFLRPLHVAWLSVTIVVVELRSNAHSEIEMKLQSLCLNSLFCHLKNTWG